MIYIIILNWNGWKDTIECLESVLALSFSGYRIVVCDNNSADDSVLKITEWIEQLSDSAVYLPGTSERGLTASAKGFQFIEFAKDKNALPDQHHRISVIQTGENRGYGSGNNVGMQFALKDPALTCLWILNNDVVVLPDSLSHLHAYHLQHPESGVIGSKLMFYHQQDCIQAIGGKYNKYLATTRHVGEFERDQGQYDYDDVVRQIDYPVGAALFVSKSYVRDVGLLSEDYFLYFEEIDWVSRGKRAGWQFGYCWQSVVFHKEGGSTGSDANPRLKSRLSDQYSLLNRVTFTKKFYGHWVWTVKLGLLLTGINRIRRGQWDRLAIVFEAIGS